MAAATFNTRAFDKFLDAFAEVLADRVSAKLETKRFSRDELVDQTTAPVPRWRYLRAARAGAFPSHRHGQRVYALRSDVMAWIRSTTRAPAKVVVEEAAPEAVNLDEIRQSLKIRRKGT